MINLSKRSIETLGYKEYPDTDILEISFGIIKVYSLRGVVFENDCKCTNSEIVTLSDRCTVVIAQSVVEASKLLISDEFSVGEWELLSETKIPPPFLLIYFKESVPRELRGGFRQQKDGCILTYDAFSSEKAEVRVWEEETLPIIVTSLIVNLSTLDNPVELVPMGRRVFGVTSGGARLTEGSKITGGGSGYVSLPKSIDKINGLLGESKKLLGVLTKDVCRNFYVALNEPDRMKQFLGYFQFLERYTHSTYKGLSYEKDAKDVFNVPQRINKPVSKFFGNVFSNSKSLAQRFHWCAILAWNNLEENDIEAFLEAKKVRDELSHGEHVEEQELPVEKVKNLALKILGTNKD